MKWTNKYIKIFSLILLCSIITYHTAHTHDVKRTYKTHPERKAYYKGRADEWHGRKQKRSYPGNADEQRAYDDGRTDMKKKMEQRGEKPHPRTKTTHPQPTKKASRVREKQSVGLEAQAELDDPSSPENRVIEFEQFD